MADFKVALFKAIAGTVTGFVMSYVKPYLVNPLAEKMGNYGKYAGVIEGFVIGFLLEAFAPDLLKEYSDVVYGAIMGAFADPAVNVPAPAPAAAPAPAPAPMPALVAPAIPGQRVSPSGIIW